MVIAGLELDRAEIREYDRAVIRVGLDDAGRDPAVDVQPRQDPDKELSEPARHFIEEVHAVGGAIHLVLIAAVEDLVTEILVDGVDRAVVLAVNDGQRLRSLVGELFLHDEGGGDLVSLIEVLVGDEAVHLRAQRDRLDERRHDHMEHRVAKFRFVGVFALQIGVHVGQIDRFRDVRFIVAPVRIDQRSDEVHSVQIAQQASVLAVAKASFLFFHSFHTP